MTFQAYVRARRLSSAFTSIRSGDSLDGTAVEVGYESLGNFREAFEHSFGCTPGSCPHRDGVLLAWLSTPLGPLVAGATDAGVCLAEFTDRRMLESQIDAVRRLFRVPVQPGMNAHLDRLRGELGDYFAGTRRTFTVPLVYPGTAFQRRVWEQLLLIPYGETRSYHEVASALGDPNAVRAVGRANGLNRISIVIPCHRVINKNGDLGGYGGGLLRKQSLLNLEQVGLEKNA